MKRLLFTFLLLFTPAVLHAQVKQSLAIDPQSSSLMWTGHAEVGTYAPSGGLSLCEGHLLFENGTLREADLIVDMNSMTQSNADLLNHLKSADFFDVARYPTTLIKIDHVANGTASGTITIKGKATPFEAPVKVTEADGRFTISGKVTLDRTRYGITYNSSSFFSSLGDKAIRNTFEVEFQINGSGQIPAKYRSNQ